MRNFRERYWRYSLFVLILGLGITICIELTPFLGGLLGAATIYVLLRRQMQVLTACRRWRRSLAASLLLAEAVLCFLVPISLIVWMVVNQVQDITLRPDSIITPLKHIAALIHEKTGYNLWQEENISSMIGMIPKLGQWVVSSIFDFGVNIVVLLFVLYFMLIGGRRMEEYCREILPFDSSVSGSVMREVHMIVRSNAIGIPLLAVVQGIVAYIGYLIFGAPSPLFWGVLTCFATIIPIFGTALVWLPLAGYMALAGEWGPAVGLALYGGLVVTHVDNVVRFVMQKKLADTHPLVTIFGVFIGLSLFGFMGVIFGPLLLEMFVFCVNIFKKRYLDGTPDKQLFVPGGAVRAHGPEAPAGRGVYEK
ncbi:AI-2E family transporter [Alistipes finegoldii]|uniref:AI-2E family transporter n=1 Tax=Alistipes finegoldii TaxID=214856 RepID=UPI002666474C|nr:AI-2E family transporter [Alistipes finegoldii]